MREPVNVFYYPDMFPEPDTLKKAVLFFDEVHFMDRPSFTFEEGFGTVGSTSPVRGTALSFQSIGVPVYVHDAPGGPIPSELREQVESDVNDPAFLKAYQEGLRDSPLFMVMQVPDANYGELGKNVQIVEKLLAIDISNEVTKDGPAMRFFRDSAVKHFDLGTSDAAAKYLVTEALTCSLKINFGLKICKANGFVPLADAAPFSSLLSTKYARAVSAMQGPHPQLLTDLGFAVFDSLVPAPVVASMTFRQAAEIRKQAETARNDFMVYLSSIGTRISGEQGDLATTIDSLITAEILPAAVKFRNSLQGIIEGFIGAVAKGAVGSVAAGAATLNFFGDLSWPRIISLSAAAGGYVLKSAIDAAIEQRKIHRECALSYVLTIPEHGTAPRKRSKARSS